MKTRFSLSKWGVVASVAAAASLSACFGGDDDNSAPSVTSQVPASASQSSAGFIAYLEALVVSDADTLEPVDTSSVTPPADDTSEPVAIN
jgi:hypothetical protein